jgi:methyl-accepting chemotaxis protein
MNALLKNMNIGPKFVAAISLVSVLVMAGGYVILNKQSDANLDELLTQRLKQIEAVVQTSRAYIATNYVAKLKKSKAGNDIITAKDHANNPDAIPFPATAAREIGEELMKSGTMNFRYVSQAPLNSANLPKDGFETEALKALASGADSYSRREDMNGTLTFRRAVPDKATSAACISCHSDKQVGDTLGALVINSRMTIAKENADKAMMNTLGLMNGPDNRRTDLRADPFHRLETHP